MSEERKERHLSGGGGSHEEGGGSSSSGSGKLSRGSVRPIDLSGITGTSSGQSGKDSQLPDAAGSGSSSLSQSPEADNINNGIRGSSHGSGNPEFEIFMADHHAKMADSEDSHIRVKELIKEACELVNSDQYDGILDQIFEELRISSPRDKSSLLSQIAAEEKSEKGCDSLLHLATETGAREIVSLLLNNGYHIFIDSTNDKLIENDQSFLPITPLAICVMHCDADMLNALLNQSSRPFDAICAAIYYYDEDRRNIEALNKLMDDPSFKEGGKILSNETLSLKALSEFYLNSIHFDKLLEACGEKSDEFLNGLRELSVEQLKDWYVSGENSEESICSLDNIQVLRDFYSDNINSETISIQEIILEFYEYHLFNCFLDQLPKNIKDQLLIALQSITNIEKRKEVLDDLIKKYGKTTTIQEAGWPFNLTPLQMLSIYRDKDTFMSVLKRLPDDRTKTPSVLRDGKGNNLLHLAVQGANLDTSFERDFLSYLLLNFPGLWNQVNNADQSPLSIACLEKNIPLVRMMAAQLEETDQVTYAFNNKPIASDVARALKSKSGAADNKEVQKLQEVQKKVVKRFHLNLNGNRSPTNRNPGPYSTPLEDAVKNGDDNTVALLLELWPGESAEILTRKQGNPYKIASELERSAPDSENGALYGQIQCRFIRFIHVESEETSREKIRKAFEGVMIDETREEISKVLNPQLQKAMLGMLDQLSSDYKAVIRDVVANNQQYDKGDLIKIYKIFYLVHELSIQASTAKIKNKDKDKIQSDKDSFERSCATKLYDEIITARQIVVVCAFIGLIIGAFAGLLLGTLLTGGGPGGLWLTLPSAEYGSVIGAGVGGFVGGVTGLAGGAAYTKWGEAFKLQRGFWSVSSSMSSVERVTELLEEKTPLLEVK